MIYHISHTYISDDGHSAMGEKRKLNWISPEEAKEEQKVEEERRQTRNWKNLLGWEAELSAAQCSAAFAEKSSTPRRPSIQLRRNIDPVTAEDSEKKMLENIKEEVGRN